MRETTLRRACRFCGTALKYSFVDLGMSPLCESYVPPERLDAMEPFYPLHVLVCHECLLVQLGEYVAPEEIFTDYAYFSSYSDTWVEHARRYANRMTAELRLGADSLVVEVASNDGYLLQHFVERGVPVLGIEPAANVARVAEEKGVPTIVRFFGRALARELADQGRRADLVVGNNVLAQAPDLNDFVEGLATILKPSGTLTLEFPHLLRLIEGNQFDTIYHEHFSYFSLHTAERVLEAHGLVLFDVEELATHGGSLRLHAARRDGVPRTISARVERIREDERRAGLTTLEGHDGFAPRVAEAKWRLLEFLIDARRRGCTIAGYGAPGKGNTLLNYCGIRTDLLEFVVDRNPYKQGKFLPGTRVPILAPDRLREAKPDYVLILPWNLEQEIVAQLAYVRDWGGRFVVPIPTVRIVE
ncbi:MAG: class I SAM-dependent methyltransferase [Armatimonadota bacterium]|nr:class I SAM-dependent methyltransferase [Armatimonadota bacterium]